VKRDDGDERLEEWKKERLLEKRMSLAVYNRELYFGEYD